MHLSLAIPGHPKMLFRFHEKRLEIPDVTPLPSPIPSIDKELKEYCNPCICETEELEEIEEGETHSDVEKTCSCIPASFLDDVSFKVNIKLNICEFLFKYCANIMQ